MFAGGAAVVAKHVKAAGADVSFSTVLGNDAAKDFVLKDLDEAGVVVHAFVDRTRPTTQKERFIADGYKMLQVDRVDNRRGLGARRCAFLSDSMADSRADVVIFSDFRHGIFNRQDASAILRERVPGRRAQGGGQPGVEPLGQYPGLHRLRSADAERARGAVRARRSGFGGAAARARSSSGAPGCKH